MLQKISSGFLIRYVDASRYPEIALHLSMSERLLSIQEIEDAITQIRDMGEPITEFTVEQSKEAGSMAICLVVDQSGSMSGTPLDNAKRAIVNFIRSISTESQINDVRIGMVSFDNSAYLRSPVSGSYGMVSKAVDEIMASGGTYIPGGIQMGIDALESVSGEKIIILLSDGQDGSDASEVIANAKSKEISIYSIGFAAADAAYLMHIAQETGGQFLQASESEELGTIYQLIQGYITNDYLVKYQAISQLEEYEREVQIDAESSSDQVNYQVGVPMESILEEDGLRPQSDFYRQIGGSDLEEGL